MFKQFWQDEDFRRLVAKANGMLAELDAIYSGLEEMDITDTDPGHNFEVRNECGSTELPQYNSKQMQAALEYIMQQSILLTRAAYNSTFYERKQEEQNNG